MLTTGSGMICGFMYLWRRNVDDLLWNDLWTELWRRNVDDLLWDDLWTELWRRIVDRDLRDLVDHGYDLIDDTLLDVPSMAYSLLDGVKSDLRAVLDVVPNDRRPIAENGVNSVNGVEVDQYNDGGYVDQCIHNGVFPWCSGYFLRYDRLLNDLLWNVVVVPSTVSGSAAIKDAAYLLRRHCSGVRRGVV